MGLSTKPKRLIVGITGATGAQYAVRLLQAARSIENLETHLVVSSAGVLNLKHELNLDKSSIHKLANYSYSFKDVGASLASGSFVTSGMVILPCSMRTLAAVAHGFSDNLITRAADVTLKERRTLVMAVRETPFNLAHLRNMTAVTEMGGIIFPPLPAFYLKTNSLQELIDHSVMRIFDLLGIETSGQRWGD